MSTSNPEEMLFARLRARDEAAFESAFDNFARRAFGLAYKLLGDREAAEEVVQEAFLALWQNAERLDPKRGRLAPLLFAIVHHKASDYRRRRGLEQRATSDIARRLPVTATVDPADVTLQRLDSTAVHQAIACLPPEQRLTLRLAYFGGYSHSQIAEAMHQPVGTVKSRLRLALKHLHHLLWGRVR